MGANLARELILDCVSDNCIDAPTPPGGDPDAWGGPGQRARLVVIEGAGVALPTEVFGPTDAPLRLVLTHGLGTPDPAARLVDVCINPASLSPWRRHRRGPHHPPPVSQGDVCCRPGAVASLRCRRRASFAFASCLA